jgi:hypothetical protein
MTPPPSAPEPGATITLELTRDEALVTMTTMRINATILLNEMNRTIAAIAFDTVATKIATAIAAAKEAAHE